MNKLFILILLLLLVVYHKGLTQILDFYGSGLQTTIKFYKGDNTNG